MNALAQRPIQVTRAVQLLWISLILGCVATALEWDLLDPELGEFASWMWGAAAVTVAIPAVLIVFIARGHNWARILMLVLTLGSVALTISWYEDVFTEPWWSGATTVILTALDVVALYWLYTNPGRRYFSP
ncbi:hypothetical protein [Usitatibacter palustris]|uniref:Uncharacterized protein n=1 Tax=Usitatibacter palustris TaxID=2732487 RepID=A0A6M4H1N4_9PROT|nr:hypothetical protein [Usitatibacter palustris]QJR13411.1 hypothetical protein DSM104440_00194 [Usitatibacter palustris]